MNIAAALVIVMIVSTLLAPVGIVAVALWGAWKCRRSSP